MILKSGKSFEIIRNIIEKLVCTPTTELIENEKERVTDEIESEKILTHIIVKRRMNIKRKHQDGRTEKEISGLGQKKFWGVGKDSKRFHKTLNRPQKSKLRKQR